MIDAWFRESDTTMSPGRTSVASTPTIAIYPVLNASEASAPKNSASAPSKSS